MTSNKQLNEAELTGKLFRPIHDLARQVHGIAPSFQEDAVGGKLSLPQMMRPQSRPEALRRFEQMFQELTQDKFGLAPTCFRVLLFLIRSPSKSDSSASVSSQT